MSNDQLTQQWESSFEIILKNKAETALRKLFSTSTHFFSIPTYLLPISQYTPVQPDAPAQVTGSVSMYFLSYAEIVQGRFLTEYAVGFIEQLLLLHK